MTAYVALTLVKNAGTMPALPGESSCARAQATKLTGLN
jgi:hypothetical protein